jgi:VWFA-related protein
MARYLFPALLFLCTIVAAQNNESDTKPDQSTPKIFRVNVSLVQVDAVVTDKEDRPVIDLTADDFIILQDGKPQKITNFSLVRLKDPDVPRPAVKKPPVKSRGAIPPPPPPSVRLKPDRVRRVIALVVDGLGLSFANTNRIREAVKKWIDEEMQPGDLVAVILTDQGLGSLEQFTDDKQMLQAAADRIRWGVGGRVGSTSFSPVSGIPGLSPLQEEERSRRLMMGSLGAIRYVVNGLETLPGRKNLIFFSENMVLHFDLATGGIFEMNLSDTVKDSMLRLIEAANRAGVVIHTIDPRGAVWTEVTVEDTFSLVGGSAMPGGGSGGPEAVIASMDSIASQRQKQWVDSQEGLSLMAQETGGLFINYRNHLDGVLRDVARDGEIYYLIGYQPDAKTIAEIQSGKTKYHNIKVRVKRPGLRVRSRSGFFTDPERQPEPLTLREQMVQALHSRFSSGDLRVRLTTLYSQTLEGKPCINALLHFDADQLAFTRGPDGKWNTTIDILSGIYDADGQQVDFTEKRWNLSVSDETYKNVLRNGVAFLMRVPVKKAGAYQMRLVLGDPGNGRLGSASHFVEVPKVDKGHLALSGIVLAADASVPKTAGDQQEGILADREINGTAAVRLFKPGDTITWAYQILNAKTNKDHKSQIQTYVRLFHEGREVFSGHPFDMTLGMQDNSDRVIGAGRMHLKRLPPGNYALQVIALDMLAKKKYRMAVQSIDFEVQGPQLAIAKPIN